METGKIKKFATEARNILKRGIEAKIMTLGFNGQGQVPEASKPQLIQGGCLWNGTIQTEGFYRQWMSLYRRVEEKGIREVYEEAAYTWFNRLMAIRILQKNHLCEPVMEYADEARTPRIVDEARIGRYPQMSEAERARLIELLDDDTKTTEQFALLVTAFCHDNAIISACFGRMEDYTELLLPLNILAEGGFVDMINHTEFISDDDFHSPELIGWLYQFYISERKDEVFAKKGKFEADEIPAATQIFTPNWIVKYMVQNTVGRIYLDNNPWEEDELKAKWNYLVSRDGGSAASPETIYRYDELTQLKFADLGCGSGHILNEIFDLLYDLYIREGYSRSEAITNIFTRNLTGVDIDTRARQLATFALMLKACQRDASFADAHCLPNVLDMPEPYLPQYADHLEEDLHTIFEGRETPKMIAEIRDALELMRDADSLGSIMKFNLSEATISALQQLDWQALAKALLLPSKSTAFASQNLCFCSLKVMLSLSQSYSALVMNPPYMGSGNMNKVLSDYVKKYYEEGKADLCTAFMVMQRERTAKNGYYANIIPPSWMFLSSFEALRKNIIERNSISSLLHLSRGVFGADFGSVSCVIQNTSNLQAKGTYFRLIERTFQEFDQKHLQMLFEKTLANHDFRYFFGDYTKDVTDIVYSEHGAKIYYPNVSQQNFEKIPGCPIGYWVSEKIKDAFSVKELVEISTPRCGMSTGNNAYYVREWFEVSASEIGLDLSRNQAKLSNLKWFPYNNAGGFRKWYGLVSNVVNWLNDGNELQTKLDPTGKRIWAHNFNLDKIFLPHVGWSDITSGTNSFRFYPQGFLFSSSANAAFVKADNNDLEVILAYCNSSIVQTLSKLLNPTFHFTPNNYQSLPFDIAKMNGIKDDVKTLCLSNISISKQDWDSHETSWDFEQNELVALASVQGPCTSSAEPLHQQCKAPAPAVQSPCTGGGVMLQQCVEAYHAKWEANFMQLHANEEELNRQFIDIYGLQDELTPDVPLSEITILQQGEISIERVQRPSSLESMPSDERFGDSQISIDDDTLAWHDDVLMKQLISYAVGVWMGRYRLDRKGLAIAHPQPSADELAAYEHNGQTVRIDDDGIIPILPSGSPFDDNLPQRIADFVRIAFGEDNLTQNLNYMEQCLGKTIEQYCLKDFWKDHKKMYQNRPIYWLFSSKKGAFQCISYMHRMTPYTAEQVRAKYLLPYIDSVQKQVGDLDARAAELSTKERKQLDTLRKTLDELREYHDRLQVVAEDTERTKFDLDDGVVVNYAKYGDVLAKLK